MGYKCVDCDNIFKVEELEDGYTGVEDEKTTVCPVCKCVDLEEIELCKLCGVREAQYYISCKFCEMETVKRFQATLYKEFDEMERECLSSYYEERSLI
jgi:hypothetical protein